LKFEFPLPIPLTKTIHDCLEEGVLPTKYYQTNLNSPSVIKMHEGMDKKGVIYQYRRFYMRENKSGVCPTLTANMGTGGHNVPLIKDDVGIRKLTPRECFNFQGFPDDFIIDGISDSHLYKQAGNSVVVPVIKRIAENIIHSIT
jgi:DNA (cytosine-5)-methyltransferase 1